MSSLGELLDLLELTPEQVSADHAAAMDFPLRVPREFVSRMKVGDPGDPLLLQVLPSHAETQAAPGFTHDPLEEARLSPVPGLLHKYHGRALMVVTGACAIHCRYCFRRHFPYNDHARDFAPALSYIAKDPTIHEVLLSGGDPLSLSDAKLFRLVERIEAIPHIKRLRLHSRLPVVLPSRITDDLIQRLRNSHLKTVIVIHSNHAQELDQEVCSALGRIREDGIILLNQTVLLRKINDQIETLTALSEALFQNGVLPYYLHVLDRVAGTAHFEVPERDAKRLVRGLLEGLPGYLVPKLVREEPGAGSKTPICPLAIDSDS